jgi:hypothetical protein
VLIEDSATIPMRAGYFEYAQSVAIDGDLALVSSRRSSSTAADPLVGAQLYRRNGSAWQFERTLHEAVEPSGDIPFAPGLALRGGFAALNFGGIFAQTSTGWVRESTSLGSGRDVEASNNRFAVATGNDNNGARIWKRDVSGTWTASAVSGGRNSNYDVQYLGGPVDLDGDWLAVDNGFLDASEPPGHRIYRDFGGSAGWQLHSRVWSDTLPLGHGVLIHNDEVLIESSQPHRGTFLFRGGAVSSNWQPAGQLQTAGSAFTAKDTETGALEMSGELVFQHRWSRDRNAFVYHVFQRSSADAALYQHVATLAARYGVSLGRTLDVSGNRVIVGSAPSFTGTDSDHTARIFELPATFVSPAIFVEDFRESWSANNWYKSAGSAYAVVQSDAARERVLRQSNTTLDTTALLEPQRVNQAIEADVTPTAFGDATSWAGLLTRQNDGANYYRVTLGNGNVIRLQRVRGGGVTTLASVTYTVPLARKFRVRLESIGNHQRVFIDGRPVFSVYDSTHARGNVGVATGRASADFDRVFISETPLQSIYQQNFASETGPWEHTGPGNWGLSGGHFRQNSLAGDARAIIGGQAADQVVQVRMRVREFGTGTPYSDQRFAGLIANYVDDRNYLYLTLRHDGSLQLRRLVNGQIQQITTYSAAANPLDWNVIRIEIVGRTVLISLNGVWRAWALDHGGAVGGKAGLVTYRTRAEFDDFIAYQP